MLPEAHKDEMIRFIKNWTPVCVTWNGQTENEFELDDNDAKGAVSLAVRMLYS